MNGAECVVRTLIASGVSTCFANPGTTEMHFVAALDRISGVKSILGLAETVVAGCADGYARMTGRPAATLLHCGPGFANAISNLHNARRANSPIVNVVGDHSTWHRAHDPVLASDIEALAGVVSGWVRTSRSAHDAGRDAAAAVQSALSPPGRIATLVLPSDCAWDEGGSPADPLPIAQPQIADLDSIASAARILRRPEPRVLLLSGAGLGSRGLAAANRIAQSTGVRLLAPAQVPRMARGRGRPPVDRIPFGIDAALKLLSGTRHLVLAGARPPVSFFGYPKKPSTLWPGDCDVHVLARPEEDIEATLEALADELSAPRNLEVAVAGDRTTAGKGAFEPESFGRTLAALLPEDAIVAEDAVTSGRGLFPMTWAAAPHDWIQITGGSLGYAFPAATGAAIGAPGRRVVCLQADGAGMYSLQALWTQARERLDVVNIVLANRRYAILQGELSAIGADPGSASAGLFDLSRPDLDWLMLSRGMGVEAARVESMEQFSDCFSAACSRRGPFLIEFRI
jgi:acetolactate synthase-1/2/3 large subunit